MMDLAIPATWRQIFTRTTPSNAVDPETSIPSFENIIQDAQLLLSYAATTGVTFNDNDVKILNDEIQKTSIDKSGNHDYTAALLSYSRVAKQLLPVTAYTLRECFVRSKQTMRFYARWGALFVVLIVSASLVTFVSSTISDSMKAEIDLANSKAITLRARLGAPSLNKVSPGQDPTFSEQDKLIDLQQLAISSRSIYGRSKQLRYLIVPGMDDPFKKKDQVELHNLCELNLGTQDIYANF
jgi:hypothetical protein